MAYYIIPYLFASCAYVLGTRYNVPSKPLLLVSTLPALVIATLRGLVGTDTAVYRSLIESFLASQATDGMQIFSGFEIGFNYLVTFLSMTGASAETIVAITTFLICISLIFAFGRNQSEAMVFIALVFPIFYFDMGMNGLRYGLAFALSKIAYDCHKNQERNCFIIFSILAVSVHISAIILLAILVLIEKISLKKILALMVVGTLSALLLYDILAFKLEAYGDFQSPSGLSGLAPLVLVVILCLSFSILAPKRLALLLGLLFLELMSYALSKFSYAGLRFQFLVLFALLCLLPPIVASIRANRIAAVILIFSVGAAGFALKARNMIDEEGLGSSPFLPYHFIWEDSPAP